MNKFRTYLKDGNVIETEGATSLIALQAAGIPPFESEFCVEVSTPNKWVYSNQLKRWFGIQDSNFKAYLQDTLSKYGDESWEDFEQRLLDSNSAFAATKIVDILLDEMSRLRIEDLCDMPDPMGRTSIQSLYKEEQNKTYTYKDFDEYREYFHTTPVDVILCHRWRITKVFNPDRFVLRLYVMNYNINMSATMFVESITEQDLDGLKRHLEKHHIRLQELWSPLFK